MSERGSLLSLLMLYPFYEGFFSALRARELHALMMTSKTMFSMVAPLLRSAQDLDTQLQEFVYGASSFRLQLRETDGVIFGDFAFRFFAGVPRECSTLDVLMTCKQGGGFVHLGEFIAYLLKEEGYYREVYPKAMFASGSEIAGVWVSRRLLYSMRANCTA
jgi:hypothetical protein